MKTIENPQTDKYGTQRYYNSKGQPHRDNDLPAVIYAFGVQEWWTNGVLQKIERETGRKYFYVNGIFDSIGDEANNKKYFYNKDWQLHKEDGPAIYEKSNIHPYGDTKRYFIKGIELNKKEHSRILKKNIKLKHIEKETNIEKRRLYIEYYGLDKYIINSKAEIIDDDEKFGTLYVKSQTKKFLGIHLDNVDEPIHMIKVKNSTPEHDGSYKFYFIRVPPSILSAKVAVAWTFGLTEEEYCPTVET